MIDEYSDDHTGWARFSDDRVMRYRLARSLTTLPLTVDARNGHIMINGGAPAKRAVWLMLNPSTADAFSIDPTVGECIKRSRAWSCDVMEVVNLFALRSPYPADLKKHAHGYRGDDGNNNMEVLAACIGAERVIAAWGNHGALGGRDILVRQLLAANGISLAHLGLTQDGYPKHPLARGKHRIPADQPLAVWFAASRTVPA